MSMFAMAGTGSRSEDWVFVGAVLGILYLVGYPLYILFLRYQHASRIKRQLVTSEYSLPTTLIPAEVSYVFSTSIKKRHLYATIIDLSNKSVLTTKHKEGRIFVEMGPKVVDNLTSAERLLVDYIEEAGRPVPIEQIIVGHTQHEINREKISGSRHYVFWWLLRDELRRKHVIEKHMTGRYTRLLISFGAGASLLISLVSVGSWRFVQMLDSGEVNFEMLCEHWRNAAMIWAILLIPLIVASFALLRFRGRMLGRHWLLTKKYRRYQRQLIAFKEYVRLVHANKLRFESKELQKESALKTKPYALAFGFIKEPPGK